MDLLYPQMAVNSFELRRAHLSDVWNLCPRVGETDLLHYQNRGDEYHVTHLPSFSRGTVAIGRLKKLKGNGGLSASAEGSRYQGLRSGQRLRAQEGAEGEEAQGTPAR